MDSSADNLIPDLPAGLPVDTPGADLVAAVAEFFGSESPLRQAPEHGGRVYEDRPQQRQMAAAVAGCLQAGEHLAIEAPTGIGKSFAYLIPAIHFARRVGKPVVVTTHTIALQEQLLSKDIPLLQQLMDVKFKAALAKGRGNYVCLHRLANAAGNDVEFLPSEDLMPEINRLLKWAGKTKDGTLADLDWQPSHRAWSSVCAEPGACPREKCDDQACFFLRARRRLYGADLIVANHALFCVDLALRRDSDGKMGILPPYAAVIVDEAQTFEDAAANNLGLRLTSYELMYLFGRLFHTRSHRGLLARDGCIEAREACVQATRVAGKYFARLLDWLESQEENPLVYTAPGHVPNELAEPLGTLCRHLRELLRTCPDDNDWCEEVKNVLGRIIAYREGLEVFLNMSEPDRVYWFERYGRDQRNMAFNVVPIDVREVLKPLLFEQDFAVVATSATLAVKGQLGYFRDRLGADDAREMILDSPYDYARQVELFLPAQDAPQPRDQAFHAYAAEAIRRFVAMTNGKAFVLFTSYRMMDEVAEELESFFRNRDLRLMIQGRELQRTQMLEAFRADTDSVIFGTESFWMGVDVPGESLSNVIIVKLPFPVPSHPLVAARCNRLEAAGRNSFRDYSLPEAILKFRQGFGRLIRGREDRGIVVVLDRRIRFSRYGRDFLASVPDCSLREV